MTPKRQAYDIRFRCMLNGCDWTARLWLRDPADAHDAMYRYIRFTMPKAERYSSEAYRVVSCDVSPDQSRPVR